jgi:ribosomal protein S18 acetylase RimI-like enzyme
MTRSSEYITAEQQKEWFKTALEKYELYLVYGIEHGVIVVEVGFGLIHLCKDESLVTGGFLPDYRNKGLGTKLFRFLLDNCDKEKPIRLEVLKTNISALKTYQRLSFSVIGENENLYFMEYKHDSVI